MRYPALEIANLRLDVYLDNQPRNEQKKIHVAQVQQIFATHTDCNDKNKLITTLNHN